MIEVVALLVFAWLGTIALGVFRRVALRRIEAMPEPITCKCGGEVLPCMGEDRQVKVAPILFVEIDPRIVLPQCVKCGTLQECSELEGVRRMYAPR